VTSAPVAELGLDLRQRCQHGGADGLRSHVVSTVLYDARLGSLTCGQDGAEVEVVVSPT